MRAVILALSLVLMVSPSHAETKNNAAFLLERCTPLASLNGDPSDPYTFSRSNPTDVVKMTYCLGFLDALTTSLQRLHNLYEAEFPDLTRLRTDEVTVKKFIAMTLLVGPDVCFPEGLTSKIAPLILVKYGRDHPEQLTDHPQKFANLAFAYAYPCSPVAR
jgi:hypothetical protein